VPIDESRPGFFNKASFLQSSFLFTSIIETPDGNQAFYLGEENELLVGLTNRFNQKVNVTAIRVSLLHPLEPTHYYIQNCTVQPYYQVLDVNSTQTFLYRFVADALLQPRDYVVVANVYLEGEEDSKRYFYQALNFTHEFVDAPSKLDLETLFIIASLLSGVLFIFYFAYSFFFGGKKSRVVVSDRNITAISSGVVQQEWISHLEKPQKKNKNKVVSKSS